MKSKYIKAQTDLKFRGDFLRFLLKETSET